MTVSSSLICVQCLDTITNEFLMPWRNDKVLRRDPFWRSLDVKLEGGYLKGGWKMGCWSWRVWENSGAVDRKKTSRERLIWGKRWMSWVWRNCGKTWAWAGPTRPIVCLNFVGILSVQGGPWMSPSPGVSHGVSGNRAPSCTFCPRTSCNTL